MEFFPLSLFLLQYRHKETNETRRHFNVYQRNKEFRDAVCKFLHRSFSHLGWVVAGLGVPRQGLWSVGSSKTCQLRQRWVGSSFRRFRLPIWVRVLVGPSYKGVKEYYFFVVVTFHWLRVVLAFKQNKAFGRIIIISPYSSKELLYIPTLLNHMFPRPTLKGNFPNKKYHT